LDSVDLQRFEARGLDKKYWAHESDAVLSWLVSRDFEGYDPFDALSSALFRYSPFALSAAARIAWTQFHKLSPVNLRPLLFVPRTRNPKALGLALTGLARQMAARGSIDRHLGDRLVKWIASSRSVNSAGWGYPFSWQNRAFFAPRGTPNAVCTAFVVGGLLDYAAVTGDSEASRLAVESIPYWTEELRRSHVNDTVCFSYTPLDNSQIHNVNLLVAATIARLGREAAKDTLVKLAKRAMQFSLAAQRPDGSWPYGEGRRQSWIDGFHTGFNLGALQRLKALLGDAEAGSARARGYAYFRRQLLDKAGRPKYYARATLYPIDIHSAAQAIVTVLEASDLELESLRLAVDIANWTQTTLGLGQGTYAYRRGRLVLNAIVYARWAQAWMFRALAELELALAKSA